MGMVSNCAKCRRVFQRMVSPLCATCYQASLTQIRDINQFMQNAPQMTLQEIADGCDIPLKDIEAIFLSGRLGAAARKVIYPCGICNQPMPALMLRGRVCQSCAERLETEPSNSYAEEAEKEKALSHSPLNTVHSTEEKGKTAHSTAPTGKADKKATSSTASPAEHPADEKAPPHVDEPTKAALQHHSYGFKRLSEK